MLERVNGWHSAEALLSRVLDAQSRFLRSMDSECLAGVFHPAVVMHDPASLPYAGDWEGLEGVAALLQRWGVLWSESHVEDPQ